MKKTLRKSLSLFLAMILLAGLCVPAAYAEGETETTISAVDDQVWTEEGSISVSVVEPDEDHTDEGSEFFPEDAFTELESGDGYMGAVGEAESGEAVLIDSDDALEPEPEFPDVTGTAVEDTDGGFEVEPNVTEDDYLSGILTSKIYADRTDVTMKKGDTVTLTISYKNFPWKGDIRFAFWKDALHKSDIAEKTAAVKNNGDSYSVTIKATKNGTCYLHFYLMDFLGITCDSVKIKITVCSPTLTSDAGSSTISLKPADTRTVKLSAGGYSGASKLEYISSNSSAYSVELGSASSGTTPLKITGRAQGSGTVTVYYKTSAGDTLATLTLKVSVTSGSLPKLTVSRSSVEVYTGGAEQVVVTCSNYSGSVKLGYSNTCDAYSLQWGTKSGNSIPVTITGSQTKTGSGTVTLYLYNQDDVLLTTAKITVKVVKPTTPTLSLSASSVTVDAGSSKGVSISIQNLNASGYRVDFSNSNNTVCTCALSGSSSPYTLTVAGNNGGTAVVTIYLKDSKGQTVDSRQISVTVKAVLKPELKASATTVSVGKGHTGSVTFSYKNCSGSIYLSYSGGNTDVCSLTWGSWSNGSIPLEIRGNGGGTVTVTVSLVQSSDKKVLASVKLTITVSPDEHKLDINRLSFGFANYSAAVSLAEYQRVYADNQIAKLLYNKYQLDEYGRPISGGMCLGCSTMSSLFYSGNVSAGEFGASSISSLTSGYKTKKSSATGYTLASTIQSMSTTWWVEALSVTYDIDKTARAIVSEIDNGRPVCLYLGGNAKDVQYAHEVVAIGYSLNGNVLTVYLYDCNNPKEYRQMTFSRPSAGSAYNQWTYKTSYETYTNSAKYMIGYTLSANVSYIWNNLGKHNVKSQYLPKSNVFWCNEDDFSLKTMDFTTMQEQDVAVYSGGVLSYSVEGVVEIPVMPAADGDKTPRGHFLVIPVDYYFVEDNDKSDGIIAMITDENLSAAVETDADFFGMCADDGTRAASIAMTPGLGDAYHITIGSSWEGDPELISIEGVGTGDGISLSSSLNMGTLSLGEGMEGASVEISMEEPKYSISAGATAGGSITPSGVFYEGENVLYRIRADENAQIAGVYVDGEYVGPVTEWYFEDICEDHSIFAEFQYDIASCTVELSSSAVIGDGTPQTPDVTVIAADGTVLEEGRDYYVCYDSNVSAGEADTVILAAAGSSYFGVTDAVFQILDSPYASAQLAGDQLQVELADAEYEAGSVLYAALYTPDGQMEQIFSQPISAGQTAFSFTLTQAALNRSGEIRLFILDERFCPIWDCSAKYLLE